MKTSNNFPGPLDYKINFDKVLKHNPAYSISGKYDFKNKDIFPGPGDYNNDLKNNCSSVKFGKEKREIKNLIDGPGVGAYDQKINHLKRSPGYKIGKAERSQSRDKDNLPGPGDYSPSYLGKKSPKYSLTKSIKTEKKEYSPGPGDYDISKKKLGGITIKRKYYFKETNFGPGPSDYSYENSKYLKSSPAFRYFLILV